MGGGGNGYHNEVENGIHAHYTQECGKLGVRYDEYWSRLDFGNGDLR